MRAELTKEDIKELKYSCRPGVIIPFLFFLLGSIFIVTLENENLPYVKFALTTWQIITASLVLYLGIWVLIGYLMIRKYVSDIRNGEKEIEVKIVMQKESKVDYEAGSGLSGLSGTGYTDQEMTPFTNCSIIVENTRYRVDEYFYKSVKVGDEVCFHYGPISRDLIRIEQKNMPIYNSTPINLFN